MSRSSLPRSTRFRRGLAVVLLAAAPLTMAGACQQEAEEAGVEVEEGEEGGEEEDD